MKTVIACVLVIWACGVSGLWAASVPLESESLYTGIARELLLAAQGDDLRWTRKVGIEVDDFDHPPYLPEVDSQAARTNRLLDKVVGQLGPAGALSMANDKFTCQLEDEVLEMEVQLTVFRSREACLRFWQRKLPERVREQLIIVDGVGDACFKRPGDTLTYLYLRRQNVHVTAKSVHDHGLFLTWLQGLDRLVVAPPQSESADPNETR